MKILKSGLEVPKKASAATGPICFVHFALRKTRGFTLRAQVLVSLEVLCSVTANPARMMRNEIDQFKKGFIQIDYGWAKTCSMM